MEIIPGELSVEGPYDHEKRTKFTLFNNHGDKALAFKIKTTRPEAMKISPHCGFIPV